MKIENALKIVVERKPQKIAPRAFEEGENLDDSSEIDFQFQIRS